MKKIFSSILNFFKSIFGSDVNINNNTMFNFKGNKNCNINFQNNGVIKDERKNNKMFNFEGNRECPIDVTVNFGKTDKLSYEEIYKNNNINSLENEFSNRIGFSCDILSLQLPDELKSFFEIKSRIVDDKLEYYTKPKSKEAYEKYPFQMKINWNKI